MTRPTHVYTINYLATLIGENLELLQEVASNSDNIDYGEMIHAHDGSEEGITTFTDRGIESLKEFLADIRTWKGGVRQLLIDNQCDPEKIERIMADEPKSSAPRPSPDGYDHSGPWPRPMPSMPELWRFTARSAGNPSPCSRLWRTSRPGWRP